MKDRKFSVTILLVILTISYFPEALFLNGILSFRDLGRYFYPLRFFTVNAIKSGVLPLWNPYIFCGTPHLALQQSVIFYPPSLIYYIWPFDLAFNIFLLAHIFLAGAFVFFLCRHWKFREGSSILAAVIFMFSGYIVSVLNLATTLSSVIWLPLILLFFDKALSSLDLKALFLSSIFLAFMFLGGEPSIFYSTLWVLLFYSVFFWLNNRKERSLKKVAAYYLYAAAIGTLLSAVQLIPFIELMGLADRTTPGLAYENLTKWSLSLKDTLSFIVPFLARTDFSKESYWKEQNWVILIYVGVFAMLFILIAALFKKDWRTKFFFFIGTIFLFVSYGSYTPFYYLVYKFIPGFQFVRYPVRFLYVTTFAIAILCGAGFDAYIKGKAEDDQRLKAFFKYLLFVLYLSAILFLALHLYRNNLIEMARQFCIKNLDPAKEGGVLFSLVAAIVNIERFAGFLTAGGLVLFFGLRLKLRQGMVSFALITLVVADLFSAMPGRQITLNAATLHATSSNIEYMKRGGSLFRFYVSPKTRDSDAFLKGKTYEEAVTNSKDMLSANWPIIYGLYDVSGYDSIRLARYSKLISLVETSGSPRETRLLDMLNTKYLVILNEIDSRGYKLVTKGNAYLYENRGAFPRAFLVGSFRVLKNEVDIANRLKSKEFDPAKEVILEEEPILGNKVTPRLRSGQAKLQSYPSASLGAGKVTRESAEIIKYSPNEVVIKTSVNSPKFLVLADSYYPGWKAYVDGKRDKVYAADYLLRAVYLDAGDHTVRFLFSPFSFKLGLILTIGTIAFIIFYIVYKKR